MHSCTPAPMSRRTIPFTPELEKKIEDWRADQRPIPDFNDAVVILVNEGLGGKKK